MGRSLHRSRDGEPGWRRVRRGGGFAYLNSRGRRLSSPTALRRIRSLAIPPAYESVWICADPDGHLQYTGIDARGRKQYRYHPRWRDVRDRHKFSRIRHLGTRLPAIRRRLARDLQSPHADRERAAAMALLLLDLTGVRIGSRGYLRENGSYGLTTLRRKHLRVDGRRARFDFRAKGGARAQIEASSPALVRALSKAGRETTALFYYRTADGERAIDASAVNARLQELAELPVSAKDLRTWKANVELLRSLRRRDAQGGSRRQRLKQAIAEVAAALGNTPAVCRKSYIDPALVAAYEDGSLDDLKPVACRGLRIDERRYLALAGA